MTTSESTLEKSTTVRPKSKGYIGTTTPARLGAVASRWLPALTAYWVERTMFAPHRSHPTNQAREVLARAQRFTAGDDALATWCWQPLHGSMQRPQPSFLASSHTPTALLVHGWAGNGGQLTRFVAPLLEHGYRVVTFDAPAHGASPGRRSSLPIVADTVAQVAARLGGIEVVIAHSAGAAAVTLALDRGLWVRRAAFVAPLDDIQTLTHGFLRSLGVSDAVIARVERNSERWLGMPWAAFRASRLAVDRHEPVLVIHDRRDREVPFSHGERLARAWHGATLHATQGLGHRRILHDPAVIEQVANFLQPRNTDSPGPTPAEPATVRCAP